MSKIRTRLYKVLKIIIIVFIALLALLLLAMHLLMPFRDSDKKIEKYFAEKNVPVVIHHENYQGEPVRFIETQGEQAPDSTLIVFVHGAPGSLSDHKAFLADSLLLTRARMVSMDRLGYGFSHYGQSVPGIGEQAAFIKFIVEQFPHKKVILCGHSFGGPIVAKFAMDYPDLAYKVIMLAPLNEPETEPMFNMAYLAKWKLTRWTLPPAINVSADEKFAHADELERIREGWQTLQVPIVHIHGTKDMLAPFSNVKFSEDHIPVSLLETVVLEGANHFLPWSHYELVKKVLLKSI